MSDAWLFIGLLLGFVAMMAAFLSQQSAHEDKLDRRAMWNGIMEELRLEFETALASCHTPEERLRLFMDWEKDSKPLRDEIIARHRKVWGIAE